MKRFISLTLSLCLAVSVLLCPAAVRADAPPYGDLNEDRLVNAADALVVLRAAVGKISLTGDLATYADVDASGKIDAVDALLILKFAVQKLDRFPADVDAPPVDPDAPHPDEKWRNMTMDEIIDEISGNTPASPIDDYYAIHDDGGMIYNPLSREMDRADRTRYNLAPKTTGTLKLSDGTTMTYSVPTDVTAYDMVPVEYSLKNGSGSGPVYVEGTTFENKSGSYYDLCLPGNVSLSFQYDGYVYADNQGSNRAYNSANFKNDRTGTQYPQYNASGLIASDTVPSGKPVWFKFTITNTGNTILDGDGNGTFCFEPFLVDSSGNQGPVANMYYRLFKALYPGESVELYIYFGASSGMQMNSGEYRIDIRCLVRNEEQNDAWGTKIWGGYIYGIGSKSITATNSPTVTHKSNATYKASRSAVRDTWLHTYEEFTTSYDAWLEPADLRESDVHVLYVQPAAWSTQLNLKLMRGNADNLRSVRIPLTVNTDSLSIRLNEKAENYIITDAGTKYPAMASQSMCDMRVNDTLNPASNVAQLDELLRMKECGVNLVTTTEAFNINTSTTPTNSISNNQDAIYFVSDVLRKLDMRMEGYTGYPFSSGTNLAAAYWYTRDSSVRTNPYGGYAGDVLAKANGLRGLYQFMRWGDNFYINGQGKTIFNTEDTRGWMRIDFNARAVLGRQTIENFRTWLQKRYGSLDALNDAWGVEYDSWDMIDPEEGTVDDHGWRGYNTTTASFYEWDVPVNDLDIFRTLERTENYAVVLDTLAHYNEQVKDIGAASVDATMGIRTEGGNVTGVVPYNTKNFHLRHAYFSQRRCAMIPQILAKSGTVSMHSDYVTLPYSVREWETLVSSSTALGITNMPLIQSNRMRDIAINRKFGDAAFGVHYNLTGENIRGAYINTQISVFQMFKAIYENGGIPGLLWEDYLCDGYVTETQEKEMKFYSQKIAEMMQTDAAKAWAVRGVPDVGAIHSTSNGVYSYNEQYIQAQVDAALARRKQQ